MIKLYVIIIFVWDLLLPCSPFARFCQPTKPPDLYKAVCEPTTSRPAPKFSGWRMEEGKEKRTNWNALEFFLFFSLVVCYLQEYRFFFFFFHIFFSMIKFRIYIYLIMHFLLPSFVASESEHLLPSFTRKCLSLV